MSEQENKKIQPLNMKELFKADEYVIPIYQRNYAWENEEIEQLIKDINDNKNENYYLGTLIVKKIGNKQYEVIDGQQRLTTLFLLILYLNSRVPEDGEMPICDSALSFEAREKSNETLEALRTIEVRKAIQEKKKKPNLPGPEIKSGYETINDFFENNKDIDVREFKKKFKSSIEIVRVEIPEDTDKNHYFEIMNTRGEQLEAHEIVKARMLRVLSANNDNCEAAASIWDACADMDSYIQMNFTPEIRTKLFENSWNKFIPESFDEISENFAEYRKSQNTEGNFFEEKSLADILKDKCKTADDTKEAEENMRFESIISFPDFLLQVKAVCGEKTDNENDEESLNSNNLIKIFEDYIQESDDKAVQAEMVKNFIFNLLKLRYLFDKYIVKREFARDYKEEGRWSLQKLESYTEKNKKPKYIASFRDDEDGKLKDNNRLRMLESCLRVTYTSAKSMHWITQVLRMLSRTNEDSLKPADLINKLERYCSQKVCDAKVFDSDSDQRTGFFIERIVFTYLDYLLYCKQEEDKELSEVVEEENKEWYFQFRNSIEHFYPRHPDNKKDWATEQYDDFGNLALVTAKGNSKFSNSEPSSKIIYDNIINQSMKLKIMKYLTKKDKDGWTPEKSKEHGRMMLGFLKRSVTKCLEEDTE